MLSRKKINKVKYRQWSPTAMSNAMQTIREKNISVRKAAKLYNVPLSTLRDRVDGRSSLETLKSGPEPLFTQEEEVKLVNFVSYMAAIGYGFSRSQVLEVASDLAVSLGKRDRDHPLSMYWFYDFMGRWPELHVTKPRGLAAIRAQSATPATIDKYFTELKSTIQKYNLKDKPQSIYNLDEKGISTEHHPPNIVAKRGISSQSITSPRGANTTIIGCGNALGQQIPPYYIFAGKRMREELLSGCLPGTAGTVTDNGWSNSEVFELYLRDHFQQFVHVSPDNPILLLFDGHTSHITLSVIEWAKNLGIVLFVLPPHTSHILQPLDVGCFGPLQKIYNKECSTYLRNHPGQTISRLNVCGISGKAYSHALSPENLRSAFRKSGIYPFDPEAFDISKIAPSKVYQVNDEVEKTDEEHRTDSNISETIANTDPNMVDNFFQSRCIASCTSETKNKKRKSLHPVVSGRAITEENVLQELKKYKEDDTMSKMISKNKGKQTKTKNSVTKQKSRKSTKTKMVTSVPDSQLPGPSRYNITAPDEDTDSCSDDEPDSSKCCVCHKNSPPALRECTGLVIVKWCQCDKCQHWTHLRFCSRVAVIRRHSEFLCPCCE